MEFRKTKLFSGRVFKVPTHIVRLDGEATHGWQVRYGKPWRMFSDHSADGTGARRSLAEAVDELARRVNRQPAPTGLRTEALARKTSDLPVGISGPKARLREGRNVVYYEFQVTLPIQGAKSRNTHVYIGTENTVTPEKIDSALAKAVALREAYALQYQKAATRAKRQTATAAGVIRMK